ncbi:hypothetical protein FB567DRAFT_524322 [Paraphoma chrysanthemicola]|uniref:Uncharacterized protein n=1 Tax=Paraphoma chrysanthemicola TaxID=798071 RepID=A0A8K0R9W8_9PLEO|nr:hypothetical protein FB567DRAFT_524322 [Paraphoma chrysanthemicola]
MSCAYSGFSTLRHAWTVLIPCILCLSVNSLRSIVVRHDADLLICSNIIAPSTLLQASSGHHVSSFQLLRAVQSSPVYLGSLLSLERHQTIASTVVDDSLSQW